MDEEIRVQMKTRNSGLAARMERAPGYFRIFIPHQNKTRQRLAASRFLFSKAAVKPTNRQTKKPERKPSGFVNAFYSVYTSQGG